jgi:hypothetical protein
MEPPADSSVPIGPEAGSEVAESAGDESTSWLARASNEVRSRPIAWVVFALFVLAGPVAVTYLFPEAPTAVAVVGGAIFGGYCALNAVPQKFL